MWKKTKYRVYRAVLIEGDPSIMRTTWWNYLLLIKFLWRSVVIIRVHTNSQFKLGFTDNKGNSWIHTRVFHDNFVRIWIRHESRHLFAINMEGRELLITIRELVDSNDPAHREIHVVWFWGFLGHCWQTMSHYYFISVRIHTIDNFEKAR